MQIAIEHTYRKLPVEKLTIHAVQSLACG